MNGRSAEDIGVGDAFIENLLKRGTYSVIIFHFKYSVDMYVQYVNCRFEPIRSKNHDCFDVKSSKL